MAAPVASADADRAGILVLGMHRSGTSAITRVLNLLGADLGDRLLPAVEGVNDAGFWEHADAVALDDKLLHWHGRPWHSVQPVAPADIGDDLLRQARLDIGALIRRDFTDASLWAIKDPRMSLLAPVWIRALLEAGIAPRVLVSVRHPDEVAASLQRRDAITGAHADLLWGTYFVAAVRASAGHRRAICDYAGLLTDWTGTLARIGDALDVQWPIDQVTARTAVETFLRPEQRRHHAHGIEVGDPDPLHASVLALYAGAVAIAEGRAGWDVLDPAIETFERVQRHAAPHVQELLEHVWAHAERARTAELDLVRLRGVDRELDQLLALRHLVAEKDAGLQAASDRLQRSDAAVAELRAHADALEATRASMREDHEAVRRRLEVVEAVVPQLRHVIEEKEARLVVAGSAQQRLESALLAVQEHAAALEPARDDLRSRLDVTDARLAEKAEQLATTAAQHARLEAALADLHGHASALEAARDALRRRAEVAEALALERDVHLSARIQELLQLQAGQAELQAHATALESARDLLLRRVEVAEVLVAERDARLVVGDQRLLQLESALAELHHHASALESARDGLLRRVDVAEAVAVEKEARLVTSGQQLQQLESAMSGLGAHAQALEAAREVLRTDVETLQRQLIVLQHAIDDRDARLAAAAAMAMRADALMADAQSRTRVLDGKLRAARAVVSPLEQLIAEQAARLVEVEASLGEGRRLVAAHEQIRATLDHALVTAETRLQDGQRQLATVQSALDVMHRSRSWRVTGPLRALVGWLRPGR